MEENRNQMPVPEENEIRLDDESRVKVLSPNMMVFKRFIRNRLAIFGLVILVLMFLFSFVGGVISPYRQQDVFRRYEMVPKEYASASINENLRYVNFEGQNLTNTEIAQFVLARNNNRSSFMVDETEFSYEMIGPDFYQISRHSQVANAITLAGKPRISAIEDVTLSQQFITDATAALASSAAEFESKGNTYFVRRVGKNSVISKTEPVAVTTKLIFDAYEVSARPLLNNAGFVAAAQQSFLNEEPEFTYDDITYRTEISEDAATIYKVDAGKDVPFASLSNLMIRPYSPDIFLTVDFKQTISNAITNNQRSFKADNSSSEEVEFTINRVNNAFTIYTPMMTQLIDTYGSPSKDHWLGTDSNGMDVLTRLMYGGRISLMVGFVVVLLELFLGVVIGGIAGYFGGIVDTLLMRFVDIFVSIPFWPIVIITGSVMDTMEVVPIVRIFLLMGILGVLGWTGIARVVRGQILTLREQDFMVATEATGIRVSKRIFKHLVPNVMPLLIVQATLSLGGIIITEATLSFLGLGIKYPFASWGSIINTATNLHVMTNYWFIWIPAGILIILTVLGFNFVGDGLRDAYDPKMKR